MKKSNENKPIHTIPNGVWEGGEINKKRKPTKEQHLNAITTDFQGNGYPISHNNQDN